jgi:hypothetical protein
LGRPRLPLHRRRWIATPEPPEEQRERGLSRRHHLQPGTASRDARR